MKRITRVSVLALVLGVLLASPVMARDYVVLISAGNTTADNTGTNSEYWYDMFLLYTSLINDGISHDDIYVLYGFGTDFNSSLENYQNPYPHPIADYDNHRDTIESVLGMLGSQMTSADQIYVWWLGHGSGSTSMSLLIENYGHSITDAQFAGYMDQITSYRLKVYSFMTCHSGGIIDDLEGPNSIVMTSSTPYETSSSANLCDNIHCEFHYYETCAFDWQTPFGICGPVDADTNGNLMISFLEAFAHAEDGTQYSTPQISDPGGHAPTGYLAVNGTPGGLIFESHQISDDETGASSGNGDGVPNPGETLELWVTIRNDGTTTSQNITGSLVSGSTSATVITASTAWNDIPAGGQGECLTPLVIDISGFAVDGESLPFTLTVTDNNGSGDMSLGFNVVAADLSYYFHRIDDTASGNGNGVIDIGEAVDVYVSLANHGGRSADAVGAQLTSTSPSVTVVQGQAGAVSIPVDGHAELTPAYRVQISGGAGEDEVLDLGLAITADGGYQTSSGFKMKVGTHFFDDVEAAGAWSLAAPGDDATTGLWVREDPIGTQATAGGQAQPEDDHTPAPGVICFVTGNAPAGSGPGENDVDGGTTTLTTPTFDLTNLIEARVTYWRWYTNNLGNNPDEDTWAVQVSTNGGTTWVDLERTTDSANSWTEQSFLIEDFVTPTSQMVFKFVASDLGAGSLVEAAVDDFEISGLAQSAAVAGGAPPLALHLARARPNPLLTGSMISFGLPVAGEVNLSLYGVDGRLVRTLAAGPTEAGVHEVIWDGTNHAGRRVAPGVYFYKLKTGERELTRKLVVIH